ncbi:MAG: SMI1/KNR4 family protein [Gemmataceae bacterium]
MWQPIRKRWQAAGIAPRPGAAAADIDAFERRHGVRLPAEVREFYAHVDGMPPGAWDEDLLSFWPLAEVGPVPALLSGCRGIPDYGGIERSLPDAGSYFVFADHSIWVHVYAVRLSADPSAPCPVVWIAGGSTWAEMAMSFGEFLRRYADDPRQVLFPGAEDAEPLPGNGGSMA